MAVTRVTFRLRFVAQSTDTLPTLLASNVGSLVWLADTDAYKRWNGSAWVDAVKGDN